MFKIESDIPVPDTVHHRPSKYPFAYMNVGDSFLAPYTSQPPSKQQMAITHAIRYFRKKYPDKTFVTRRQDDGIRIWKTT